MSHDGPLMWQEPRDAMTAVVRQRVPAPSGNTWCLVSYPKVLVTLSLFDSNAHKRPDMGWVGNGGWPGAMGGGVKDIYM